VKKTQVIGMVLIMSFLFSLSASADSVILTKAATNITPQATVAIHYDYIIFTNSTSNYVNRTSTNRIVYHNNNATMVFDWVPQGTSWFLKAEPTLVDIFESKWNLNNWSRNKLNDNTVPYRSCSQLHRSGGSYRVIKWNIHCKPNGRWQMDVNATNHPREPDGYPMNLNKTGKFAKRKWRLC